MRISLQDLCPQYSKLFLVHPIDFVDYPSLLHQPRIAVKVETDPILTSSTVVFILRPAVSQYFCKVPVTAVLYTDLLVLNISRSVISISVILGTDVHIL